MPIRDFVLFFDNLETGESGMIQFSGTHYEWIFELWESLNPTTTLTIVEV